MVDEKNHKKYVAIVPGKHKFAVLEVDSASCFLLLLGLSSAFLVFLPTKFKKNYLKLNKVIMNMRHVFTFSTVFEYDFSFDLVSLSSSSLISDVSLSEVSFSESASLSRLWFRFLLMPSS
jgi:hypothetical protein